MLFFILNGGVAIFETLDVLVKVATTTGKPAPAISKLLVQRTINSQLIALVHNNIIVTHQASCRYQIFCFYRLDDRLLELRRAKVVVANQQMFTSDEKERRCARLWCLPPQKGLTDRRDFDDAVVPLSGYFGDEPMLQEVKDVLLSRLVLKDDLQMFNDLGGDNLEDYPVI